MFTELSAVIALFLFHFASNVATGHDLIWVDILRIWIEITHGMILPYEAKH